MTRPINGALKTLERPIFALLCLLVAACQPSTQAIETTVRGELQNRLNDTYSDTSAVKVTRIIAVRDSGHKYVGVATVSAFGGSLSLPLTVMADRHNALFTVSSADWKRFRDAVIAQRLRALTTRTGGYIYSDIVLKDRALLTSFSPSLLHDKSDLNLFTDRLETVMPVKHTGSYYFGEGCKEDQCGSEEAAWTIDSKTGAGTAIIEWTTNGTLDRGEKVFTVFGVGGPSQMPLPLVRWAIGQGVAGPDDVAYVP